MKITPVRLQTVWTSQLEAREGTEPPPSILLPFSLLPSASLPLPCTPQPWSQALQVGLSLQGLGSWVQSRHQVLVLAGVLSIPFPSWLLCLVTGGKERFPFSTMRGPSL